MNESFRGQWAVILGASSGFGAACAKEFVKQGMNIAGVHLDRKAGQAAVDTVIKELKKYDVDVKFYNVNAADAEKRTEVLEDLKKVSQGHVRVLLHSLAFGALKPMIAAKSEEALSQSQIEMTLDVMANSLVYWSQDLAQKDFFTKNARIFAMTSAGSSRVWTSYGAVSAAKAALESYCRQLALELAPKNICVNAILAGVTDTPALRKIPGHTEMIEVAQKRNPMGRLTTPEDVAKAMVCLTQAGCSFITGNTIRVDGGENIAD